MFWKLFNGLANAQIFSLASNKRRLYSTVLTVAITLAFLGALFAAAFQCDGPRYWAIREKPASRCFNRVSNSGNIRSWLLIGFEQPAFWAAVGGVDILSDVILHGLLAFTIYKSQMVRVQKRAAFTIVCLYLLR